MFDCIIKSCLRGKNIQQHEEIHQKHTVENILDISNYSGHHMSGKVYIKAQKKSDHQIMSRLFDLMILNFIFIIMCIPVVTIGTNLTACS